MNPQPPRSASPQEDHGFQSEQRNHAWAIRATWPTQRIIRHRSHGPNGQPGPPEALGQYNQKGHRTTEKLTRTAIQGDKGRNGAQWSHQNEQLTRAHLHNPSQRGIRGPWANHQRQRTESQKDLRWN